MNSKETIMLKLYNGDYIIGDYETDTNFDILSGIGTNPSLVDLATVINLENPRNFVFMPTMGGTMKAGFQPVCLFDKKSRNNLAIRVVQVMLIVRESDIPKEIINGYNSEITGISFASAKDIAAVNDSKKGDFII